MTKNTEQKKGEKIVVKLEAELEDIIPTYLENRYRDIETILRALEQADYETIRLLGHNMKGSGGGYGFDEITSIGKNLEQAARDKDSRKIRQTIDELSTYLKNIDTVYD